MRLACFFSNEFVSCFPVSPLGTGTLSGQIVMEGFLRLKMKPWLRRMITRGMAIIPAALVAATTGKDGVGKVRECQGLL